MVKAERTPPLDGRRFATGDAMGGISLEPCAIAERVLLRADNEAVAALTGVLGIELPAAPKSSTIAGPVMALWLGPDEWLLIGEPGNDLNAKLASAEGGDFSAVDISHRNTAITVTGERAAIALSAGCPQDLSLAAFPVGACSRTILGKAEIVLLREAENAFRVECWRSFSDYVWKYLVDAAKSA